MTVIAAHGGGDDFALVLSDEEKFGLHGELALDVLERIVPWPGQPAGLPEGDDRVGIAAFKGADMHEGQPARSRGMARSLRNR